MEKIVVYKGTDNKKKTFEFKLKQSYIEISYENEDKLIIDYKELISFSYNEKENLLLLEYEETKEKSNLLFLNFAKTIKGNT